MEILKNPKISAVEREKSMKVHLKCPKTNFHIF